jgi:hypothetical protein
MQMSDSAASRPFTLERGPNLRPESKKPPYFEFNLR